MGTESESANIEAFPLDRDQEKYQFNDTHTGTVKMPII